MQCRFGDSHERWASKQIPLPAAHHGTVFQLFQFLSRAANNARRNPRQLRHLHTVTLACRAVFYAVQKHNLALMFDHFQMDIGDLFMLLAEAGEFEIVGGE